MNPLGHGFMADQDLLNGDSSIELSHTCHNSFLTATVGLGYLGAAFYLFFCCFLFFQAVLAKGSHKIVDLVQLSLISMLLFGIASPMFPGMPTILVTLSILIYKIRNTKDEKSINYGI
jgi:O-antigen ligase